MSSSYFTTINDGHMRLTLQFVFTVFLVGSVHLVTGQSILQGDLDVLLGEPWKGQLEYLDYGSDERVSIPLEISVTKEDGSEYLMQFRYNNEPHANSTEKIKIRKQGAYLNDEEVISRSKESEKLIIKTIANGEDNGKTAKFYFTYELSPNQFRISKKVVYEGEEDGFIRNEFILSR